MLECQCAPYYEPLYVLFSVYYLALGSPKASDHMTAEQHDKPFICVNDDNKSQNQ